MVLIVSLSIYLSIVCGLTIYKINEKLNQHTAGRNVGAWRCWWCWCDDPAAAAVVVEARILLVGYIEVRQVTLAGYNSSGGATLVVRSQCSITRESIQRIVATSSALEALMW